ncbi:MAG: selenide, water dikinase SelD [Chloroflexota bacterium]|nr:selenide, water dikinase SelD [Chloroflexota bacterium]
MQTQEQLRLTSLASRAGCAAKMGPDTLSRVLRPLTMRTHPDLLVGLQTSDDAAVFRLAPDLAVIQTIDFFTPIVDDPWTFGAIAAANAMSDVYAMGGEVRLALNVAAFPEDLPPDVVTAIFAGAAAKVEEAGGIIAGGHTIVAAEPTFGLSVTGTVHPDQILTKAGARAGDRLVLTKPIGTGVVATALKRGAAAAPDVTAAVDSMLTLNRGVAGTARAAGGINACTDITGFGLLGHASEVAAKSEVRLQLHAGAIPILPHALDYVARGHVPAGLHRNRDYYSALGTGIAIADAVDDRLAALLFDPQTSGGLLFSVAADALAALTAAFTNADLPYWVIGEVAAGSGIVVSP